MFHFDHTSTTAGRASRRPVTVPRMAVAIEFEIRVASRRRDPAGREEALMVEVEIRVAGAVDQTWVSGGMPGFTADPAPAATMIRGVLAPGEHLSTILNVLARHGVVPFDVWVDPDGPGG
jgi:hypothetical protein